MFRWIGLATKKLILAAIRVYWWTLSPLLGNVCRYHPSCSRYTAVCVERFGPVKGSWLGIKRVSRCHPWAEGGFDPPPELGEGEHACCEHHGS